MKPLIIANWKCNPETFKEAKKIFNAVKRGVKKSAEVVICPPFVFLSELGEKGLLLGAQNVCFENMGAYTGEVSALMLKDLGVEYVIIGHSERRKYFGETDIDINKKIKKSIEAKLKIIFCVGETKEEWQAHQKPEVLERQITEGLKGITRDEIKNIIIAYEPVWAIGTGNNCSVDETMSSIIFIRKIVAELYNREIADNMRIVYGGSVKPDNSASYIKEAGANGLLVGGASLNPEEFIKIVESA
jgi:triosephosphate isomerase